MWMSPRPVLNSLHSSILGSNISCWFFRLVKNFLNSHNAVRSCCWGIVKAFHCLILCKVKAGFCRQRENCGIKIYADDIWRFISNFSCPLHEIFVGQQTLCCGGADVIALLKWDLLWKWEEVLRRSTHFIFFTVELVVNCGDTACGTAGGRRLRAAGSTWKGSRLRTTSIAGDRWLLLRQIERFIFLERPVEKVWRKACKP